MSQPQLTQVMRQVVAPLTLEQTMLVRQLMTLGTLLVEEQMIMQPERMTAQEEQIQLELRRVTRGEMQLPEQIGGGGEIQVEAQVGPEKYSE